MLFAKRKWGWWINLHQQDNFKLKLLYFKKGGQISNQRHLHRNELWLFLFGRGKPSGSIAVRGGQFVHFPRMKWHQYTAHRRTLVLEVQYGSLCEESDIERL